MYVCMCYACSAPADHPTYAAQRTEHRSREWVRCTQLSMRLIDLHLHLPIQLGGIMIIVWYVVCMCYVCTYVCMLVGCVIESWLVVCMYASVQRPERKAYRGGRVCVKRRGRGVCSVRRDGHGGRKCTSGMADVAGIKYQRKRKPCKEEIISVICAAISRGAPRP